MQLSTLKQKRDEPRNDAAQTARKGLPSTRKAARGKWQDLSEEDAVYPLCQVVMKVGIAGNKERTIKVLDGNHMMEAENYKVQMTLGLLNCTWKVAHAIMDTGAGPNLIKLEPMDPS